MHLGIKRDTPEPSGNVKSKTWVPANEKSKLENLERRIKRVLPGSSETSRLKRHVKKYSSGQPTVKKVVDNGGKNTECNKDSMEYGLKNFRKYDDFLTSAALKILFLCQPQTCSTLIFHEHPRPNSTTSMQAE